jgi:EAL domain-containing protein (putative c-di-GMP-specific phosphodiesterase class I)
MTARTEEELHPAAVIRRVIDERAVRVVYQPIVETKTGKLFAYEALVRSTSPAFDNPGALFAAAVTHSCAGELGRLIRELAIEGCQDHPLFLNIHPVELDDRWLIRFDDPVSRHGHAVYLEITEGVPLSHFRMCTAVLTELRSRGIALVIDDLGAGYSNLKYIADLEPRVVKLDRALVSGLTPNTRMFELVSGIIDLCHDLDALVVAEGIETAAELHAAKIAGADLAQGYLLARPAFPLPEISMPPSVAPSDRPTIRRSRVEKRPALPGQRHSSVRSPRDTG